MSYPYQGITPNEYQRLAIRTENTPRFINIAGKTEAENATLDGLIHGAVGLCTEAGELQDMLKKHVMYGKPLDITNAVEECGDALWYIAIVLSKAGVTLEDCMDRNIAKLRVRFPDKYTNQAALNRDLSAERAELERPSIIKGFVSTDRLDNEGDVVNQDGIDWSGGGLGEDPNPTEPKE